MTHLTPMQRCELDRIRDRKGRCEVLRLPGRSIKIILSPHPDDTTTLPAELILDSEGRCIHRQQRGVAL